MVLRRAALIAAVLLASAAQPIASQSESRAQVRVNLLPAGEPDSLDPGRATFADAGTAAVVRQLFEPLLRLDDHLTPQPAAAGSYDVSSDGSVYTFHLRPDGRWSDGQPVTAAQFVYAWRRLLDPRASNNFGAFFTAAGITTVSAIDDLTFEVRLSGPFGPLPHVAALWVAAPVRPDVVTANPDGWAREAASIVGNGPFSISEWQHGDHMTLVPNPSYVEHGPWPRPSLSRVTVTMQTSERAALPGFRDGSLDWVLVPDVETNAVLNDPALAPRAQSYNELTTLWIGLNTARSGLSNVDVRRALSRGIDRVALVRDTAGGTSVPTSSLIPPGMPGYAADAGRDLDFDPQAARVLLAGAHLDPAAPLTLTYLNTPSFQRRADYVQAQWRDHLGVTVTLVGRDEAAYTDAIASGDYDLAFGGWSADYPDAQDWFTSLFSCGGAFNSFNYCNPMLDQTVARADIATTPEDRLALYGQAQTLLLRDAPIVPLFVRGRVALVQPWVQSVDGDRLPVTSSDEYPGSLLLDKIRVLAH